MKNAFRLFYLAEPQPRISELELKLKKFSLAKREKKFLLVFFLSFAALYLLVQLLVPEKYLELIAAVQAGLLQNAGVASSSFGAIVFANSAEFEIVRDCSGFVMVALLASLLLATGAKNYWKKLVLFGLVLLAFNILRLFLTLFVGARFGQQALEATHFTLWIVDAGVVLALWAFGEGLLNFENS